MRRHSGRSDRQPHRQSDHRDYTPLVTVILTLLLILAFALPTPAHSAPFTDIGAGLPGMNNGDLAWGDYDNDGDLDLLATGTISGQPATVIYRNNGGTFTNIGAGLVPVEQGDVAWGDFDNDGDLDLVVTGVNGSGRVAAIYRNNNGTFIDNGDTLIAVSRACVAWGDLDLDGDLDLIMAGQITAGAVAKVYRNDHGAFFLNAGMSLPGVIDGALSLADVDQDGLLDLAMSGTTNGSGHLASVFYNMGSTFLEVPLAFFGGSIDWGDYDHDGDLDLAVAGYDGSTYRSSIYRNDLGSLTDIGAGLSGLGGGDAHWGDYDNDGDLDLLLIGFSGTQDLSIVYRNDGGTFTDIGAGLIGVSGQGGSAWGDYDGDGDLDIALLGAPASGNTTRIYRNDLGTHNTPPQAPTNLTVQSSCANTIFLRWDLAVDAQTPSTGLSYNIRVGTTPGGTQVLSPMASLTTGYRRVPAMGNTGSRAYAYLFLPATPGRYFWSVQAVDGGLAGSPFASEQVFDVGPSVQGRAESFYGPAVAVQSVQTEFGDNTLAQPGFANGSELDQMFATMVGGRLYLLIAGNLESNFNKLEIFFDTKPGGQNRLRGDNPDVSFGGLNRMGDDGSGNGLTFDPGFEPDYFMTVTGGDTGDGNYSLFASWAEMLTNGGGAGRFLGQGAASSCGQLSSGNNPDGILLSIDNQNLGGVGAGTGAASGAGVTQGIELSIPASAIGISGCYKICAFVNGVNHDFVSNQVLGPLSAPQGNLGEPRNVNFGALAGQQYVSLCPTGLDVSGRPPVNDVSMSVGPNPMNARASIHFELARAEPVVLEVLDIQGARVRTLERQVFLGGMHHVMWDGKGDGGRSMASGVYFIRLRAGAMMATRAVTLLR